MHSISIHICVYVEKKTFSCIDGTQLRSTKHLLYDKKIEKWG